MNLSFQSWITRVQCGFSNQTPIVSFVVTWRDVVRSGCGGILMYLKLEYRGQHFGQGVRSIQGTVWESGNVKLHILHASWNSIRITTSRRIRTQVRYENIYITLIWNPEGRSLVGWTRHWWVSKIDCKIVREWECGLDSSGSRGMQWRYFKKATNHVQYPWDVKNLTIRWEGLRAVVVVGCKILNYPWKRKKERKRQNVRSSKRDGDRTGTHICTLIRSEEVE